MKQVNQRRIVPISAIMLVLFSLLGIFQLFVIAGGYELEASAVKKIAPWAYEPFLKLVGEHPETRPDWAAVIEKAEESSVVTIGGFSPEEIPVKLDLEPLPPTNIVIEPTIPEPEPVVNPEDVVPVG